jgi:hypothetical protein
VRVNGRDPKAVGGEGCQVLDMVEGGVGLSVQTLVPLPGFPSPDVQDIVGDRDFVEWRCPVIKRDIQC